MRAVLMSLLLFWTAPAMAEVNVHPGPATYRLDDANGNSFALYPGDAYRSNVNPKDVVTSLKDLEARAHALPAGTRIVWTPARRSADGLPLLFGRAADSRDFSAFCASHHLDLAVTPAAKP